MAISIIWQLKTAEIHAKRIAEKNKIWYDQIGCK